MFMPESLFNYIIIKVLGEGGMSRVYLGEDPITHQKVAIKELLPNLAHSKDLRERFRREAQIMAKLDHPNIVKLIRYEETTTSFYLIMEYVEGMDLEQHIKEVTGPISEPKAIEIMLTLLDAFGYAHEKGVVHRDIKPANIIITRDGKVKVLDFGIAKIVDENASGRTQTGTRIGTVAYMSPEQVNAVSDIDLRTDIYSLGVMLHQMITGKAAYDTTTSSDFEVQTLIVKEPLPRASSIYPYASDHLQKLIDIATQKKRENRFQDCDQFKLKLLTKKEKQKDNPIKKTPKKTPPPPPKKEDSSSWIILFSIFVIIVCAIIFIGSYIKSNSDSYSAEEIVDTSAVTVDTTAVVVDTTAVIVDTTAVTIDTTALTFEAPAAQKPVPQTKTVTFNNYSNYDISLAVGFYHDNLWQSIGWYIIKPNDLIIYPLPNSFAGDSIFWYAQNSKGDKYEGTSSFCIDNNVFHFYTYQNCKQYANFFKLDLTGSNTVQNLQ
jgi:serine/threonine protein kinase